MKKPLEWWLGLIITIAWIISLGLIIKYGHV